MEKFVYLLRAREAAFEAAKANGVAAGRLRVSFPDELSFAPVRAKTSVLADVEVGKGGARTEASAVAEAAAPVTAAGAMPAMASGGGYSGPLVYRQGEGMRPDVAAAFDRMAAAASHAGISLVVNSAFRSDAEQAALFAANPDPQWVAPPGPLAAPLRDRAGPRARLRLRLAGRQRRPVRLPPALLLGALALRLHAGPAALLGGRELGGGGERRWRRVRRRRPALLRPGPLPRAAAGRRLPLERLRRAARRAADGRVELQPLRGLGGGRRGHRPVHPLDRRRLRPRRSLRPGRRDRGPGPPDVGPDPPARLAQLALAAYNAGPGAVEACHCVPSIPETTAYVSRILALLGGAGALVVPSFEAVREFGWWSD